MISAISAIEVAELRICLQIEEQPINMKIRKLITYISYIHSMMNVFIICEHNMYCMQYVLNYICTVKNMYVHMCVKLVN
jgi:hypothetical protein